MLDTFVHPLQVLSDFSLKKNYKVSLLSSFTRHTEVNNFPKITQQEVAEPRLEEGPRDCRIHVLCKTLGWSLNAARAYLHKQKPKWKEMSRN